MLSTLESYYTLEPELELDFSPDEGREEVDDAEDS